MKTSDPSDWNSSSIESGQQVTINWISANRDGDVFPEPNRSLSKRFCRL